METFQVHGSKTFLTAGWIPAAVWAAIGLGLAAPVYAQSYQGVDQVEMWSGMKRVDRYSSSMPIKQMAFETTAVDAQGRTIAPAAYTVKPSNAVPSNYGTMSVPPGAGNSPWDKPSCTSGTACDHQTTSGKSSSGSECQPGPVTLPVYNLGSSDNSVANPGTKPQTDGSLGKETSSRATVLPLLTEKISEEHTVLPLKPSPESAPETSKPSPSVKAQVNAPPAVRVYNNGSAGQLIGSSAALCLVPLIFLGGLAFIVWRYLPRPGTVFRVEFVNAQGTVIGAPVVYAGTGSMIAATGPQAAGPASGISAGEATARAPEIIREETVHAFGPTMEEELTKKKPTAEQKSGAVVQDIFKKNLELRQKIGVLQAVPA